MRLLTTYLFPAGTPRLAWNPRTMPELPEVETVARDLASQVEGRRILEVERLDWPRMVETPADPAAFVGALAGRTIESVGRRAKWLLLRLDAGLTLALHLRMSGSVYVTAPDQAPDKHVHLILRLDDERAIFFHDTRKFGRARLLDPAGLAALDAAHGPEPLEDAFTPAVLGQRLAGRSTRLKPLLLDQAVVAGLGNIYVDEALWLARIHPERAATALAREEVQALHAAIREVLTLSIARKGSTFRDYRTGYGEAGGNQDFFNVYARGGEPCPRCGGPIARMVLAQRGTHFCPTCQRAPRG